MGSNPSKAVPSDPRRRTYSDGGRSNRHPPDPRTPEFVPIRGKALHSSDEQIPHSFGGKYSKPCGPRSNEPYFQNPPVNYKGRPVWRQDEPEWQQDPRFPSSQDRIDRFRADISRDHHHYKSMADEMQKINTDLRIKDNNHKATSEGYEVGRRAANRCVARVLADAKLTIALRHAAARYGHMDKYPSVYATPDSLREHEKQALFAHRLAVRRVNDREKLESGQERVWIEERLPSGKKRRTQAWQDRSGYH